MNARMTTGVLVVVGLGGWLRLGGSAFGQGPGGDVVQGPPEEWELVKITDDPDLDMYGYTNIRGEIVFVKRVLSNPGELNDEVFLYDNGKIRQLTFNNVNELFPGINDAGTIVWQRASNPSQIIVWRDGVEEQITDNEVGDFRPTVGNSELIMWSREIGDAHSELFEWRDGVVSQVTEIGVSNLNVRINSNDDFAWVKYDFTVEPHWRATIMCSIDGVMHELTDGTTQAQGSDINDLGVVGWHDNQGQRA